MKIQASFVKDDKWVAWSDDVPGALTQGATLKEARENLADGVRMIREPIDLSKLPKSKVLIEQLEVWPQNSMGLSKPAGSPARLTRMSDQS
jgi:hypothetical protein